MKHLITVAVAFAAAAAYVAYKNRKVVEIEIKTEQPAKPEEAPAAEETAKPEEAEKTEEPAKEDAPKAEKPALRRRRRLPRTPGTRATTRPLNRRTSEPATQKN